MFSFKLIIKDNAMTLNWIQVLSKSGNAFIFPRVTNESLCVQQGSHNCPHCSL